MSESKQRVCRKGSGEIIEPMPQKEVAEEMTRRGYPMTKASVSMMETRIRRKLIQHPEIDALFRRMVDGTI